MKAGDIPLPGPDFAQFTGGPLDGQNWGLVAWPPPEQLGMDDMPEGVAAIANGGHYERISMSLFPEPLPGIARGARYEWRET